MAGSVDHQFAGKKLVKGSYVRPEKFQFME